MEELLELKKELEACRPLNKGELKRLQEDYIVENTYNSNAIEGSTITLDETYYIIKEGLTVSGKSIKEHLEVIGHKEALDYILEISKDNKTDLNERTIKDIHSLVLMEDTQNKGRYRDINVRVGSHVPPEPYDVPIKMENLLLNYSRVEKTIENIAKFHLDFESIHPFIDGNGRAGRLIMNLELIKQGYLPINIKFKDQERYYDAFREYDKTKNPHIMINMIIEYEKEAIKERLSSVEQKESNIDKLSNC